MRPENLGFEDCDLNLIFRIIQKGNQKNNNNNHTSSNNTSKLPLPRELDINEQPVKVYSHSKTKSFDGTKQNNAQELSKESTSLGSKECKCQLSSEQTSSENTSIKKSSEVFSCLSENTEINSSDKESEIITDKYSDTPDGITTTSTICTSTPSVVSPTPKQNTLFSKKKSYRCLKQRTGISKGASKSLYCDKCKKSTHWVLFQFFSPNNSDYHKEGISKDMNTNQTENNRIEYEKRVNRKYYKNNLIDRYNCSSFCPYKKDFENFCKQNSCNKYQKNKISRENLCKNSPESEILKKEVNKECSEAQIEDNKNQHVSDKESLGNCYEKNKTVENICEDNKEQKQPQPEIEGCIQKKSNSASRSCSNSSLTDPCKKQCYKESPATVQSDENFEKKHLNLPKKWKTFCRDASKEEIKDDCFQVHAYKVVIDKNSTCKNTSENKKPKEEFCKRSSKFIIKKKCDCGNINKDKDPKDEFSENQNNKFTKVEDNSKGSSICRICPRKKQSYEDFCKEKERERCNQLAENNECFPKDSKDSRLEPKLSSSCSDKNSISTQDDSSETLSSKSMGRKKCTCKKINKHRDLEQSLCQIKLKEIFSEDILAKDKDKELEENSNADQSHSCIQKKKCSCKDKRNCKREQNKEYSEVQVVDSNHNVISSICPNICDKKPIQKCPRKKQSFEDFCKEKEIESFNQLRKHDDCSSTYSQDSQSEFESNLSNSDKMSVSNREYFDNEQVFCEEKYSTSLPDRPNFPTGHSKDKEPNRSFNKDLSNGANNKRKCSCKDKTECKIDQVEEYCTVQSDIDTNTTSCICYDFYGKDTSPKRSNHKWKQSFDDFCKRNDRLSQLVEDSRCSKKVLLESSPESDVISPTPRGLSTSNQFIESQLVYKLLRKCELESDTSLSSVKKKRNPIYLVEYKTGAEIYSGDSESEFESSFISSKNSIELVHPIDNHKSSTEYLNGLGSIPEFSTENSNIISTSIQLLNSHQCSIQSLRDGESKSNLYLLKQNINNIDRDTREKNKTLLCNKPSKYSKRNKRNLKSSSQPRTLYKKMIQNCKKKFDSENYKKNNKYKHYITVQALEKGIGTQKSKESLKQTNSYGKELCVKWSQYLKLIQRESDEELCRKYNENLKEQEDYLELVNNTNSLEPQVIPSQLDCPSNMNSHKTLPGSIKSLVSKIEKEESPSSIPVTGAGPVKSIKKDNTVWDNCLSILLGSSNVKESKVKGIDTTKPASCPSSMDTESGSKKCFTNPMKSEIKPDNLDVISEDSKICTSHSVVYNKDNENLTCKITINRLTSINEETEKHHENFCKKGLPNENESSKGRPIPVKLTDKLVSLDKETIEAFSEAHNQTIATIKYAMQDIAGKVYRTTSEVAAGAVTRIQSESAKQIEIIKNYKQCEESELQKYCKEYSENKLKKFINKISDTNNNNQVEYSLQKVCDQVMNTVSSTMSFINESFLNNWKHRSLNDDSSEYDVPDPNLYNKNCTAKPISNVPQNHISMSAMLAFITSKIWTLFSTNNDQNVNVETVSSNASDTSISNDINESETESDEDLMNKLIE